MNVRLGWGLVLLGTYAVLVIPASWVYLARTNMVWSSAQAKAMAKRLSLQVERDPSRNGRATLTQATLKQLLEEIRNRRALHHVRTVGAEDKRRRLRSVGVTERSRESM